MQDTTANAPSGVAQAWQRTKARAFSRFSTGCLVTAVIAEMAWFLAFWSIVLRARIACGVWPRAGHFEGAEFVPSTIDPSVFQLHAASVWFGLMAIVYMLPFALLFLLASVPLRGLRQDWRLVAVFVAVSALLAWNLLRDPGAFFLWFVD